MKGMIDGDGDLYIERGSEVAKQICPHSDNSPCGDWCPLFGEPHKLTVCIGDEIEVGGASLDLCRAALHFEEFEDNRK